jgi:hypothetical protein
MQGKAKHEQILTIYQKRSQLDLVTLKYALPHQYGADLFVFPGCQHRLHAPRRLVGPSRRGGCCSQGSAL